MRGIVVRNKARMVTQGYTQEEEIDYDEVFAPVARIEAIRLFLAWFEDPEFPDRVYKVEKALYGLHQAPRAWKMGFLLAKKYVDEILKKFGFSTMKAASTPMETSKPLLKDTEAEDVDVHLYRSMIGSMMYLTVSRPDIMFVVCACAKFQDTPKVSHLHDVKRIFRYLKGQPKLGLWYPKGLNHFLLGSLFIIVTIQNDTILPTLQQKLRVSRLQLIAVDRKATEISQSSGPTTLVADETVHEERGDSMERAATTATSLDAEQGSGNIFRTQSTTTLNEPILHGTGSCSGPRRQETILGDRPAQTRVLDLENVKDAQALEIKKLKKRVKKLESKKKSRTPQLKRRLFKVRIESSAEKSLGDQEDSSKQGRNEIDQDEGISYAPITTTGVSISTTKPSTPPPTTTTTTIPIEDEDLTIAQTLMKIKSEKSKAKGVTMQEPSESGTRVRVHPLQIDPKDKGKAKMVEPEKPKKKKDQIEYDADVAQRLQAELDEEARLEREREEEASKAANIAEWEMFKL
ncbi:uncharacterized mitochondrial protein-like protein [Tanacetum coccineum]